MKFKCMCVCVHAHAYVYVCPKAIDNGEVHMVAPHKDSIVFHGISVEIFAFPLEYTLKLWPQLGWY